MLKTYDEIKIGDRADYKRTITEDDIKLFAEVSGDHNPLHLDEDYAKKTFFQGRIAHGMLSASFISTVLASELPGPGSIYLKQDLVFKKPVRIGDTITASVEVIKKNDEKKRITMKTTCVDQQNETVVDGEALVMMMRL
ncbi:MAG: MaoC family dehydratase [Candidatus Heimdallarchaeota archaeon]|nr:MAG: MaoC family dehydratase [Candidatus Heimdallarchaeota archaeon]